MKFTDRYIKSIKQKKHAYRIFEKNIDKGFGVRITPSGSISFFIQYSLNTKTRFYNLGRYPSVSLPQARDRCREVRLNIDRGIDPRENNKTADGSVENIINNYVQWMKKSGKKSWKKVQSDLAYNCSDIMHLPANAVTPLDIRQLLYKIIKRGAPVQSNRIRSYLHRAFELGIFHDNDPQNINNEFMFNLSRNPVSAVPKDTSVEKSGERNLSFDEIKTLWLSNEIPQQFKLIIQLLLIYGCRTWELVGARKDEFDYKNRVWEIPADRIKNNKTLLLPITPLAKYILDDSRIYSRDSLYLFPGRYSDHKPLSKTSLNNAIHRIKKIEKFTPRDIRRTVKIRMGEASISKEMRDRIQNHSLTDVSTKHYDHYDYLNEKKQALLVWESKLNRVLSLNTIAGSYQYKLESVCTNNKLKVDINGK